MSIITEPGIHYDLPEADYHADPVEGGSLSQSGAKVLQKPGGPARFHWWRTHPQPSKPHFDLGKAVHAEVLGSGAEWVENPYPDFRSKAAREWRDEQVGAGLVVLSSDDAERVRGMAAAIAASPLADELLVGEREVSMFTRDPSGVMLRGRVDMVHGDLGIVDLKTTGRLASDEDFTRSVWNFGYHQQAAWYMDQADELQLCEPRFRFVVQETQPPYLIGFYELTDDYVGVGRDLNRQAIDLYAECTQRNDWPGLEASVVPLLPPAWAYDDEIETE